MSHETKDRRPPLRIDAVVAYVGVRRNYLEKLLCGGGGFVFNKIKPWLDALLTPRQGTPEHPTPNEPLVQCCWIQTRPPQDGDAGGAEAAHFYVENGTVILCSEDGKPTGLQERLGAGGDPRAIAGRLRKRQWIKDRGESDFSRPLHYARSGNA
jgi:hypothetical protein